MSIDKCCVCGDFIDTDDFPETYRYGVTYVPPFIVDNKRVLVRGFIKKSTIKDIECVCDNCFEDYLNREKRNRRRGE